MSAEKCQVSQLENTSLDSKFNQTRAELHAMWLSVLLTKHQSPFNSVCILLSSEIESIFCY